MLCERCQKRIRKVEVERERSRLHDDEWINSLACTAAGLVGLEEREIRGPSKTEAITFKRWIAMALVRRRGPSYPRIDHSTIIHAIKQINARMAESPSLSRHIEELDARMVEASRDGVAEAAA